MDMEAQVEGVWEFRNATYHTHVYYYMKSSRSCSWILYSIGKYKNMYTPLKFSY